MGKTTRLCKIGWLYTIFESLVWSRCYRRTAFNYIETS
nr:MAG TPA: hypothetical protein [Caudoviricetes sp.]